MNHEFFRHPILTFLVSIFKFSKTRSPDHSNLQALSFAQSVRGGCFKISHRQSTALIGAWSRSTGSTGGPCCCHIASASASHRRGRINTWQVFCKISRNVPTVNKKINEWKIILSKIVFFPFSIPVFYEFSWVRATKKTWRTGSMNTSVPLNRIWPQNHEHLLHRHSVYGHRLPPPPRSEPQKVQISQETSHLMRSLTNKTFRFGRILWDDVMAIYGIYIDLLGCTSSSMIFGCVCKIM